MASSSLTPLHVAQHYDQIKERDRSDRAKSRIYYLRSFNNWVKCSLMNKCLRMLGLQVSPYVLDLGCGKGGDVTKWKRYGARAVTFVDISEKSIEQCRERYNNCRGVQYKASFHVLDLTRDDLNEVLPKSSNYNLVSCQFMAHYACGSFESISRLLHNVSARLLPNGLFFGTTTDSFELVRRWRSAGSDEFGNEIYKVNFNKMQWPPPLFGAEILFKLHDLIECPEYLVYFPAFERIAKDYGLELIYHRNFKDFFDEHSSNYGLLSRMEALEPYPPLPNIELLGPPESYRHAETALQKLKCNCVGTLSSSEWEVATIYVVFIFRKSF